MIINSGNAKIACIMVGLPARGKTYIGQRITRYLNWLGIKSRVFNVGNYRRKNFGADKDHHFFDPYNAEAVEQRKQAATEAIKDMIAWLNGGGSNGTESNAGRSGVLGLSNPNANPNPSPSPSPSVESADSGNAISTESKTAMVAIYDATNSTKSRRKMIQEYCKEAGIMPLFIESVCNDQEIIFANIKEVKLSSPDYAGKNDPDAAVRDFMLRISEYEKTYETIDEADLSYVKMIDTGSQFVIHLVQDYLQSRIVFYLMNLHIRPRTIFLCRHGESELNVQGRIGGDADLSSRGKQFAVLLPELIQTNLPGKNLTVWTSTLKRTVQTAEKLPYPKLAWKALEELDSGVCDGLTYEEIAQLYPEDYALRDEDKYHYRYRGGESYHDVVVRLESIIMELERQENILIISHQAVLRCIYGYFMNVPQQEIPYINIPLHTVLQLTPKAYSCEEIRFKVNIDCVDTFRPKPSK